MQAKCIDLAVAILYIVLVSVFFGWGLFRRTRKANPASMTNPWWNVMDGSEVHSINREKNENPPMQVKTNFVSMYISIMCVLRFISVMLCVWFESLNLLLCFMI